jgi:hypothetical protein
VERRPVNYPIAREVVALVYAVIVGYMYRPDPVSQFMEELFVTFNEKMVRVEADHQFGERLKDVFQLICDSSQACTRDIFYTEYGSDLLCQGQKLFY